MPYTMLGDGHLECKIGGGLKSRHIKGRYEIYLDLPLTEVETSPRKTESQQGLHRGSALRSMKSRSSMATLTACFIDPASPTD